jgi:dimethylaniline monooxygenase (N-oxide forming)
LARIVEELRSYIFPTDTPDFPLAADMDKYLNAYATHFSIPPRARLSTVVYRAEWSDKVGKWRVESSTAGGPRLVEDFDKVIYSMGPDQIPNIPSVPGMEKFAGGVVHSIAFKKYVKRQP